MEFTQGSSPTPETLQPLSSFTGTPLLLSPFLSLEESSALWELRRGAENLGPPLCGLVSSGGQLPGSAPGQLRGLGEVRKPPHPGAEKEHLRWDAEFHL